ncbi:MAG: PBP1A family penicillin-binding protein [Firmicutes bacterium]|nr:PBP1A family penicillin-binding protein [Bacillota bacterium]
MRHFTRYVLICLVVLFLLLLGAVGLLTATVAGMGDLPPEETPLTSTFYDRNGEVIATRFEQNRFIIRLEELPAYVPRAFIAIEDHRFYEHFGLDIQALLRALFRNLQEGRVVEGGSTITQQLARNLFLTHERTWKRKLQEALLTLQLERKYSKNEILEKYLNTIYFGHSAYGIEAAARTYFNKPAAELTLAEAALLAGIPRGPGLYSPYLGEQAREAAKKRQAAVLSRMVEEGFITEQEKETALQQELVFSGREALQASRQFGAYFIDYLINHEIMDKLSGYTNDPLVIYRGGLHIYTTLDKKMQQVAEEVFADPAVLPETIINDEGDEVPLQAAMVALDPEDGSVLAMVGGRDFSKSQVNRALTRRSPGSSFKLFTYAAALENGYTAATVRDSAPVSYHIPGTNEPYEPTEYGERFFGKLRLREAIARSSNVIAVKINDELGPEKTVEMAHRLGIESEVEPVLSNPLGTSVVTPLEMTAAYAVFANQGYRVEPRFITKITDANGRVLYEASSPQRREVLDPRIAYLLTDMMKGVTAPGGTASSLGPLLERIIAAKTGTSQNHRDSFMVGYTPELVAAVWVGNDDNKSLGWGQTGAVRAGQIWVRFVNGALQGQPVTDFTRPPGLTEILICPETGLLHNPRCSEEPVRELFLPGTEPSRRCSWPECPYCPPEPEWNWNEGWWYSRPGDFESSNNDTDGHNTSD